MILASVMKGLNQMKIIYKDAWQEQSHEVKPAILFQVGVQQKSDSDNVFHMYRTNRLRHFSQLLVNFLLTG